MALDTTPPPKTASADPAIIKDHPFVSRGEWWDLCEECGLACAAHEEVSPEAVEAERQSRIGYYSDDNPEVLD